MFGKTEQLAVASYEECQSVNFQSRRIGFSFPIPKAMNIADAFDVCQAIVHLKMGKDVPDKQRLRKLANDHLKIDLLDLVPKEDAEAWAEGTKDARKKTERTSRAIQARRERDQLYGQVSRIVDGMDDGHY